MNPLQAANPGGRLQAAETYLISSSAAHNASILHLSGLCSSHQGLREQRDALQQKLADKKEAYGTSLRDVKLVSARLIQEREAEIFALKRAAAAGGGGAKA